jgi:hypothetical protein
VEQAIPPVRRSEALRTSLQRSKLLSPVGVHQNHVPCGEDDIRACTPGSTDAAGFAHVAAPIVSNKSCSSRSLSNQPRAHPGTAVINAPFLQNVGRVIWDLQPRSTRRLVSCLAKAVSGPDKTMYPTRSVGLLWSLSPVARNPDLEDLTNRGCRSCHREIDKQRGPRSIV